MRIGIVGSGFVGATAAYALVMRGIGRQIVLVDRNHARSRAEADDILHAVPFAHPLDVVAGDYSDLEGASVVLLTAGVGQQPGETRLQLLARNAAVFREIESATYYGVGSALARIVDAVLRDERSVLTVCAPAAEVAGVRNTTVSLPRLVGGAGVLETLPLALPPDEEEALARSARVVREAIDELNADA